MAEIIMPEGYFFTYNTETEVAINKEIKDHFQSSLAKNLHLTACLQPLFVAGERIE